MIENNLALIVIYHYKLKYLKSLIKILILRLDGGYTIRNFDATGYALKTNLPSNTAFRGYGGPEGAIVIETVMDHIAHALKLDPAEGT